MSKKGNPYNLKLNKSDKYVKNTNNKSIIKQMIEKEFDFNKTIHFGYISKSNDENIIYKLKYHGSKKR
jgi:hypothetical protein